MNIEITVREGEALWRVLDWACREIMPGTSQDDFRIAENFKRQLMPRAQSVTVGDAGRGSWERPDHYGGEENPFEPIKIIEHYDLNFNLGSVIKYVLRAPFKGTALLDLKKAYTYIGFEIRRREKAGETE